MPAERPARVTATVPPRHARSATAGRGLPWVVIVAALILGHLGVVVIFVLGRTVNTDVGFTVGAVQALATGPIVPTVHVVAMVALLAAMRRPRWQDGASITTAAVWIGQCTLLITSAVTRTGSVPLYAQALVVPITVVAVATAVTWGFAHDEEQ